MANNINYTIRDHHIDYGVKVVLADLIVHEDAQREVNIRRVNSMAANFMPNAAGSLVLADYNGALSIVDGMHRALAAAKAGLTEMEAEVHRGINREEQAQLFLIKNRESRKPKPLEQYKVGVTAGLSPYVDVERVLGDRGLAVGRHKTREIRAVATLLRIAEIRGPAVLGRALDTIKEAWDSAPESWEGPLIEGVARFLHLHGEEATPSVLAAKLRKSGTAATWISKIIGAASSGLYGAGDNSRATISYRLVVECWNKGRSSRRIAA